MGRSRRQSGVGAAANGAVVDDGATPVRSATSDRGPGRRGVAAVNRGSARAWKTAFTARLTAASGRRSCRATSNLVGLNPETVRRYLRGVSMPSPLFLARLCERLDISPDWLLTGRGPMRRTEQERAFVRAAPPWIVLRRIAETLAPETKAAARRGRARSTCGPDGRTGLDAPAIPQARAEEALEPLAPM